MVQNRQYERVTLWHDATHTRHFLIPDGLTLPFGTLTLKTFTHKHLSVDPTAVAPFELTPAETQIWLQDNLNQAAADIRTVVSNWIASWRPKTTST